MHLGGPLPSGRVTPYRAAQLAARRSRLARKAGVSAPSGDGRSRGVCEPRAELHRPSRMLRAVVQASSSCETEGLHRDGNGLTNSLRTQRTPIQSVAST